jgi:hypothetical protein
MQREGSIRLEIVTGKKIPAVRAGLWQNHVLVSREGGWENL